MMTVKPPIAPDVAGVIGDYAERVENRSLLLDKFVLHKSWPSMYIGRSRDPLKWDDASRWSFIRMAQNGDAVLAREEGSQRRLAEGRNAIEENREKARMKLDAICRLRKCSCRSLPGALSKQKLRQNEEFARALASRPGQKAVLFGELQGRLIVNLSDSLIQNAGICLDRNTGIPYLPGTAVKGVARHVALTALRKGDWTLAEFMTVFGSSEADFTGKGELAAFAGQVAKEAQTRKGLVDFLPANPITPPSIEVDISTVHYPDYYGSGREEDLSIEKPRPNSFPVVAAGVRYVFCIVATDVRVTDAIFTKAKQALLGAMTERGFGAKTAAGYGWFKDVTDDVFADLRRREEREKAEVAARAAAEKAAAEEAARKAAAEEKVAELAKLSPSERVVYEWKQLPNLKAIVNGDKIKKFTKLSNDDKTAVVEALRMPEGIGHEVWMVIKGNVSDKKLLKLDGRSAEGEIRRHYKTLTDGKGKMP